MEDVFTINELGDYAFPNPRFASDEGLLAYGGDLSPSRLLVAYRQGIFPWFNDTDPILWWSPNPRLILLPTDFKVSKSLSKTIKSGIFEVKFDHDFKSVIRNCASTPRSRQNGTWITLQMQEAYIELHKMGFAHSVETYLDDKLVGGLYGIAMGKGFFGESMFAHVSDASKVALKTLSDVLACKGYDFIDCQVRTEHLVKLGAVEISRDDFLDRLKLTLQKPSDIGSWQDFI
ncbi:Leucyl/phenylalanyl-tRNA--protein transferase [Sulfurovum sp. enrichment culture clone C5]|uniref:Leucyl/phenylalanyl-tRNA--protein transferase n=1 Tax=Sulfurovum sp. enrichment culture clone C5 TaxID=497650 RepID=A0A0S4XRA6_9BACT|nr:Leucyl/phenylalanyl-tRNA--protein transferase [Sulfurovum sp. enrichment culture clone C5]